MCRSVLLLSLFVSKHYDASPAHVSSWSVLWILQGVQTHPHLSCKSVGVVCMCTRARVCVMEGRTKMEEVNTCYTSGHRHAQKVLEISFWPWNTWNGVFFFSSPFERIKFYANFVQSLEKKEQIYTRTMNYSLTENVQFLWAKKCNTF